MPLFCLILLITDKFMKVFLTIIPFILGLVISPLSVCAKTVKDKKAKAAAKADNSKKKAANAKTKSTLKTKAKPKRKRAEGAPSEELIALASKQVGSLSSG